MPNSEVRWMNSRRGIPSSSAALPLETRLRRYNSEHDHFTRRLLDQLTQSRQETAEVFAEIQSSGIHRGCSSFMLPLSEEAIVKNGRSLLRGQAAKGKA